MIADLEKTFVSVVIYVHNDEKQIFDFLERINKALAASFKYYEIICVNDNSQDSTVEIIKNFSRTVQNVVVSIVNMSYYQGLELSMNAGVDLSIGDFVFEFDSIILDYDLGLIMQVYYRSLKGFDIVSAAPRNIRQSSSKLFYSIFNRFSCEHVELRTETFRILSRRVINRINAMSKTIPYRKAIYAHCGLKTDIIVYENSTTQKAEFDKVAEKKRRETAIDSLILFTNVAYKAAFALTKLMMVVSILIGIYAIVVFIKNQPVAGWTTTMLFLAFGFLGMFGIFAIVIKYLSVLIDLVFKKLSYATDSIEKLTK